MPESGLKTHIFYEKTCFWAFFGLFYYIIRYKVILNLVILSKMMYLDYYDKNKLLDTTISPKSGL